MEVTFTPVTAVHIETYLLVGITSYKEHYLHLWENKDPSPFINAHLTKEGVLKGLTDSKQLFYIISADKHNVGILNITFDAHKENSKNNLLLNKIYLLKAYSGIGIGSKTLDFIHNLAKKYKKEVVFLYAMKKGKPLNFYKKHGYTIVEEAFIDLPKVLDTEKEMWLMTKNV